MQVAAHEAIPDIVAIEEKCREGAAVALFREQKMIRVIAVQALVRKLDFFPVCAVHAVCTMNDLPCMEAALGTHGGEDEVTVSVLNGDVRILTVFIVESIHSLAGDQKFQFQELREERAGEIKISSIGFGIPLITGKAGMAENCVRIFRCVDGHCEFLAQRTGSVVEVALVSKCVA